MKREKINVLKKRMREDTNLKSVTILEKGLTITLITNRNFILLADKNHIKELVKYERKGIAPVSNLKEDLKEFFFKEKNHRWIEEKVIIHVKTNRARRKWRVVIIFKDSQNVAL